MFSQHNTNNSYETINDVTIHIPLLSNNTNNITNIYNITTKNCTINLLVPFYSGVFEHWMCILGALRRLITNGISINECDDIILTVPYDYDYSLYRFPREVFTITVLNSTYPKKPAKPRKFHKDYRCGKHSLIQFREYIIKKYKLKNNFNLSYSNPLFYEKYGDILIIDRNSPKGRSIQNISNLYNTLTQRYSYYRNIKLVYFEDMPTIEAFHHILNSSIIITPHGAAEINGIMIHPNIKYIKLIELCPPYTHCNWKCKLNGTNTYVPADLCPFLYQFIFELTNISIYGLGTEDIHWNCYEYCQKQFYWNKIHHPPEGLRGRLKNIKSVPVDPNYVISIIDSNYSNLYVHGNSKILAKKLSFTPQNFLFYNQST